MVDTTKAFFAQLGKRGNEPLLHNVSGTIRWDIEDTGNWFVAMLTWIDTYRDRNGDGYVEYSRRNKETGLENQHESSRIFRTQLLIAE